MSLGMRMSGTQVRSENGVTLWRAAGGMVSQGEISLRVWGGADYGTEAEMTNRGRTGELSACNMHIFICV